MSDDVSCKNVTDHGCKEPEADDKGGVLVTVV